MLQTVVIIGAGPAGLLLAHYLLRRGTYRVALYERRPDPLLVQGAQSRTFPISLQERGCKALRAIAGLEEAIAAESVFCNGTLTYRPNGKTRYIPRGVPILTIDRNRLVTILLRHLLETYSSDRVTVRFNCSCIEVDELTHTVTLQPEGQEAISVPYDRLVGADGAQSVIRAYLVNHTGLQCNQAYASDAYLSVFLSRLNLDLGLSLAPDKIHAWNRDHKTRMLMVPQPGDRLNGVLIFDAHQNPLAELSTAEEIRAFFQTNFPTFGQLMSLEEAAALLHRPVGRVLTVECDRFHQGDRILILGDAAHAVSPSLGQGCNASLEDVGILGQLLERYEDDWAQVLPMFSQQRVPDAHALQELSNYSFPRTKRLVVEFFLRLTLSRFLHRWFPQWFKPFVFDLILDADLPYSQVLHYSQDWVNQVKRGNP